MTNELSVEEAVELLKEKRMEINYQVNGTTRFSKALEMAIKTLEQQPSDNCVSREDGINKIEEWADGFEDGEYFSGKSVADAIRACGGIIAELPPVTPTISKMEQVEDRIRELIRGFDNEHPALFADYMQEFNNHPISEIIDYMWDMHYLIEDIKYRLPNEGGEEE